MIFFNISRDGYIAVLALSGNHWKQEESIYSPQELLEKDIGNQKFLDDFLELERASYRSKVHKV